MRVEQLDLHCETKTLDNVICRSNPTLTVTLTLYPHPLPFTLTLTRPYAYPSVASLSFRPFPSSLVFIVGWVLWVLWLGLVIGCRGWLSWVVVHMTARVSNSYPEPLTPNPNPNNP